MKNESATKFIAFLAIIATPFALGAFVLAWAPASQYSFTDQQYDGYVPPRDIAGLVERTQDSTVTVNCDLSKKEGYIGSGWVIKLKTKFSKEMPTSIITNHHVIDLCLEKKGKITIRTLAGKEFPVEVDKFDKKRDLAVLAANTKLKPLQLSQYPPLPGYWLMAVVTADGFEGSVAFGNALNWTATEVFITANISHGNSGGPLIDNEGNVIGTNTFGSKKEQYNIAMSLDAMCKKIIKCEGKYYWND